MSTRREGLGKEGGDVNKKLRFGCRWRKYEKEPSEVVQMSLLAVCLLVEELMLRHVSRSRL